MYFDFITVYVPDVEKSLQFYNGILGLEILKRHPIEGGELAFVGVNGQPTIEFIGNPGNAGNTYNGFSIGIAVESLEDAVALLERHGHPVIRGPISPDPSTVFSYIKDSDGIEVQLIEHKE